MFCDNLISLRKMRNLSQEDLAEKLGISRQTLSKYETGETVPDIEKCKQIADFFDTSVDELITDAPAGCLPLPQKGKHLFGVVKMGERGQIQIPVRARKMFDLKPGDDLVILGDENSGLAVLKEEFFVQMVNMIQKGEEK